MDYFIKTADESQLNAILVAAGVCVITLATDGIPEQRSATEGFALDVIGQILKPTGKMLTTDGREYPEVKALSGFHSNLRGKLTKAQEKKLSAFLIAPPSNPTRVWA